MAAQSAIYQLLQAAAAMGQLPPAMGGNPNTGSGGPVPLFPQPVAGEAERMRALMVDAENQGRRAGAYSYPAYTRHFRGDTNQNSGLLANEPADMFDGTMFEDTGRLPVPPVLQDQPPARPQGPFDPNFGVPRAMHAPASALRGQFGYQNPMDQLTYRDFSRPGDPSVMRTMEMRPGDPPPEIQQLAQYTGGQGNPNGDVDFPMERDWVVGKYPYDRNDGYLSTGLESPTAGRFHYDTPRSVQRSQWGRPFSASNENARLSRPINAFNDELLNPASVSPNRMRSAGRRDYSALTSMLPGFKDSQYPGSNNGRSYMVPGRTPVGATGMFGSPDPLAGYNDRIVQPHDWNPSAQPSGTPGDPYSTRAPSPAQGVTDSGISKAEMLENARNRPNMAGWNAGMDAIRARSAEMEASLPDRKAAEDSQYWAAHDERMGGMSLDTPIERALRSNTGRQGGLLEKGREFKRQPRSHMTLADSMAGIHGRPGKAAPPRASLSEMERETRSARRANDERERRSNETPAQQLAREGRNDAGLQKVQELYRQRKNVAKANKDYATLADNTMYRNEVEQANKMRELAVARRSGPAAVAALIGRGDKARGHQILEADLALKRQFQQDQVRRDQMQFYGNMGMQQAQMQQGAWQHQQAMENARRQQILDANQNIAQNQIASRALDMQDPNAGMTPEQIAYQSSQASAVALDEGFNQASARDRGQWVMDRIKDGYTVNEIEASMRRVAPDGSWSSDYTGATIDDPTPRTLSQFWFGGADYPLPAGYAAAIAKARARDAKAAAAAGR